jgi:Fe-S cluster assembly ATP-binding protein
MTATAPLLSLRDLRVDVGERNVLKSVTLDVPAGALLVLMGANGSGKSTLGLALAGHPRYKVTGGQARFGGQDLLAMNPQQRARAGLFLSFQAPPEIPGVKNNLFIRTALNAVREARGEPALDAFDFLGSARTAATRLGCPRRCWARPVNDGFSGGERKRNELLQLALLQPRLAVLDEIDSGMDIDGVRAVVELVQDLRSRGTAFVVVSHYLQLIESLAPDAVLQARPGLHRRDGRAGAGARDRAHRLCTCPRANPRSGGGLRWTAPAPTPCLPAAASLRAWIPRAARILPPPAAAGGRGLAGRAGRSLPAPAMRRRWPAPAGPCTRWARHAPSRVDARWLDAADPAQRAELLRRACRAR